MWSFLSGVSIVCFLCSYGVALALEISRLYFRLPVRIIILFAFLGIGLLTHAIYLGAGASRPDAAPFSTWHDWCLVAAWLLAAVYFVSELRRPATTQGVFFLPVVLALIAAAWFLRHEPPFARHESLRAWGMVHGICLLVGTTAVAVGFVGGLMYLVQSDRLRKKIPPKEGLKLPTLEWLQVFTERMLVISSAMIGLGLMTGVIMNTVSHANETANIPWTDPVVWSSAILFSWLAAMSIFNTLYRPARQGRKVAYLVVASFLFLAIELGIVFFAPSKHTSSSKPAAKLHPIPTRSVSEEFNQTPQESP
jgi:Cytochrome C assembly protein